MSGERRDNALTPGEEIANTVTHGLGALLSLAGLIAMIVIASGRAQGKAAAVASCAVYGASLLLLYLFSTLYHAVTHRGAKRIFRILDHSAIYLLIAGTYTPFTLLALHGTWGWTLFGVIWTLAAAGIAVKCLHTGRWQILSTSLYVLMGWLGLVALRPLLAVLPWHAVLWLLAGGIFYTTGVAFFASRRPYAHSVWHVFVLAGSICHFITVWAYLLPHTA